MITLGKTIEEGFSGSLETRFALSGTHDVYLDFQGRSVSDFVINGKAVVGVKFDRHRIIIPFNALKAQNVV